MMNPFRSRSRSQPRGIFFKGSSAAVEAPTPEKKIKTVFEAVPEDVENGEQGTPISNLFNKGNHRRRKGPDEKLPPPVMQLMHYEVTLTNDVSEYIWNGFAHDWNHASNMAFKETNYGDEQKPTVTNIVCNGEVSRKQMVKVLSESLDEAMKDRKFRMAMIATGFRGYNQYTDKELRDEYVSNMSTK